MPLPGRFDNRFNIPDFRSPTRFGFNSLSASNQYRWIPRPSIDPSPRDIATGNLRRSRDDLFNGKTITIAKIVNPAFTAVLKVF